MNVDDTIRIFTNLFCMIYFIFLVCIVYYMIKSFKENKKSLCCFINYSRNNEFLIHVNTASNLKVKPDFVIKIKYINKDKIEIIKILKYNINDDVLKDKLKIIEDIYYNNKEEIMLLLYHLSIKDYKMFGTGYIYCIYDTKSKSLSFETVLDKCGPVVIEKGGTEYEISR